MIEKKENWLSKLVEEIPRKIDFKFRRGDEEHGSEHLPEMDPIRLINEIENEAIDEIVFVAGLRDAIIRLTAERDHYKHLALEREALAERAGSENEA